MRYPVFLQEKQTIGFVAPSFGCATEPYYSAFLNAQKKLKEMGYHLSLGPNCYEQKGIGISNDPMLCAKELQEMYESNENDVLISCGGGELMCEVVPYLDFSRLKNARPKWYMGFSDNTNFTFLSTTIADTAAIYGPCASAFGMEPWHESIQDAFDVLCGKMQKIHGYDLWEKEWLKNEEKPLLPYNVTEPTSFTIFKGKQELQSVEFAGRLVGGCMDCLVNLLGTEFDHVKEFNKRYQDEKIIWFLEACDLNIMSIRRAIWQMKHAGWFEHVGGFLIGRPLAFGQEMFGINHIEAVTALLAEYEVPIVLDLDIGHFAPMMPIVSGATAKMSATKESFELTYTWK